MYVYILIESIDFHDNIIKLYVNKDKAIEDMDKLKRKAKKLDEPPIYRVETHILKG